MRLLLRLKVPLNDIGGVFRICIETHKQLLVTVPRYLTVLLIDIKTLNLLVEFVQLPLDGRNPLI
jgi:hypothetical protein